MLTAALETASIPSSSRRDDKRPVIAQCLSGSWWMAAITSLMDRAWNAEKLQQSGTVTNDGAATPAVDARRCIHCQCSGASADLLFKKHVHQPTSSAKCDRGQ